MLIAYSALSSAGEDGKGCREFGRKTGESGAIEEAAWD